MEDESDVYETLNGEERTNLTRYCPWCCVLMIQSSRDIQCPKCHYGSRAAKSPGRLASEMLNR